MVTLSYQLWKKSKWRLYFDNGLFINDNGTDNHSQLADELTDNAGIDNVDTTIDISIWQHDSFSGDTLKEKWKNELQLPH